MKTKGKVIGVLNSKGGVGKSTLALHIGMALYHNRVFNSENKNNKVVLLDTDTPQYSLSNLRKSELDFLKANTLSSMSNKVNNLYVKEFEPLIINDMLISDMVDNIELIKDNYEFSIVDVVGTINTEDFNEEFLKCFDYIIVPMNAEFEPMRSTVEFLQNVIIPSSEKFNFKYDVALNNIHHSKQRYCKDVVEVLKGNDFNFLNTIIPKKDKFVKYKFEDTAGLYSSLIYTYEESIFDLVKEITNRLN